LKLKAKPLNRSYKRQYVTGSSAPYSSAGKNLRESPDFIGPPFLLHIPSVRPGFPPSLALDFLHKSLAVNQALNSDPAPNHIPGIAGLEVLAGRDSLSIKWKLQISFSFPAPEDCTC